MEGERKLWVGTSGYHYRHWREAFYPPGLRQQDYLQHYIGVFDTVEINNSFYMLPKAETFAAWREAVPPDFQFAVKASRYLTHMKKLKDPQEPLNRFFGSVEHLREKLGPVLFQLPPRWGLNTDRLRHFLEALPPYHRYTVEFRDPSWYVPEIYDLLRNHRVAFCIYELDGHLSPREVTADFAYIRLHGPEGKYNGSYSDETLAWWATWATDQVRQGRDVYIYFDNDMNAYAPHNAQRLKQLLHYEQNKSKGYND